MKQHDNTDIIEKIEDTLLSRESKAKKVIHDIINELKLVNKEMNLQLEGNIIIDITDLLNEAYSKDLENFRVFSNNFALMPLPEDAPYGRLLLEQTNIEFANKKPYIVFPLHAGLHGYNLNDLLIMGGIDITVDENFKNLAKCKFYQNTLYLPDQLTRIPGWIIKA